jgi:hypothetical protein
VLFIASTFWMRRSISRDAEQLVEDQPRVANHRQRLARRAPADRIGVGAGVAVEAAAGLVDVLDAQLHRRNRGLVADLLGHDLVDRGAGVDVRALRLLGVGLGQEHRRRAEVIAADLGRGERLGVVDVGVADDGQVVAVRFERCERRRREVEARAGSGRRPQVLLGAESGAAGGAVHHLHRDQSPLGRQRLGQRRARRHHRVEQRQRQRRAHALQQRAPRKVPFRDQLHFTLLNAA